MIFEKEISSLIKVELDKAMKLTKGEKKIVYTRVDCTNGP